MEGTELSLDTSAAEDEEKVVPRARSKRGRKTQAAETVLLEVEQSTDKTQEEKNSSETCTRGRKLRKCDSPSEDEVSRDESNEETKKEKSGRPKETTKRSLRKRWLHHKCGLMSKDKHGNACTSSL